MLRLSRRTFRRNKKSSKKTTPANDEVAVADATKKAVPASNIAIVVTKECEGRKKKSEHGLDDGGTAAVARRDVDPFQYPDKYFENRVLQRSWLVHTPYGVGTVEACRTLIPGETDEEKDDGETLFEVDRKGEYTYHIRLACDSDSVGPYSRLVTNKSYPSVDPEIGSEVVLTCFYGNQSSTPQRGRVIKLRPDARQAVVRLVTWRLVRQTPPITVTTTVNRGHKGTALAKSPKRKQYPTVSFVTCYLGYDSIQVVSPKSVDDLNAYETLLYVYERQHLAYEQYVTRQYEVCCELYESAISAIGSLLFDKRLSETQTVRGNLILTQIRCCNQAAICCLHMSNYQGVIGHAMSALKMLRALEKKREMSQEISSSASSSCMSSDCEPGADRQQKRELDRICGELRVFGVWRIKSMQLLTLALVKFCQWEHAKEVCLQAHKIIVKYTTQTPPAASSSRRSAFQDYLRRRSQLLHVDKSLLRLFARIEQRRGGRVNLSDRSIVVVEQEHAGAEDEVSTLEDIDAEWLDEDEEKDMAKDWQPLAVVVGQLPNEGSILLLPPPKKEDSDSVISEASCDFSYGATARLEFGTKALASVTEDCALDRSYVDPKPDGERHTAPMPLDRTTALHDSRQAFATAMTSDSDESLYEGTAKISPTEKDVTALSPCGSGCEWDEVDLDEVVKTGGSFDTNHTSSAVTIQALFRGVLARRTWWAMHMKLSIAASTIQAWFRSVLKCRALQRELVVLRNAAIKLQSVHRAHLIRCRYLQLVIAVRTIQRFARASVARWRAAKASVVLQARVRGRIQRRKYARQLGGATCIQAFVRSTLARNSFNDTMQGIKNAVMTIESWYQDSVRRQAQQWYLSSASAAATKIQSIFRCRRDLKRYCRHVDSAICIQSLSRTLLAKRSLKEAKEASLPACTSIQAWYRCSRCRKEFSQKRDAAIQLQAAVRGWRDRRCYIHHRRQVIEACVEIQAWYRDLSQRAALNQYKLAADAAAQTIQHLLRMFLTRQRYARLKASAIIAQKVCRAHQARNFVLQRKVMVLRACCKLQAWYRAIAHRHAFNQMQMSVVVLQSLARRAQARHRFRQSRRLMVTAAITIQAMFRLSLERWKRQTYVSSIVLCQAKSRGWLSRRLVEQMKLRFVNMQLAAITIQSPARGYLARARYLQFKANATAAATRIETLYRSIKYRRQYERLRKAITLIQANVRIYGTARKLNASQTGACVTIQGLARGSSARRSLSNSTQAATRIAALYRGVSQRAKFDRIKNAAVSPGPEPAVASLGSASNPCENRLSALRGTPEASVCIKEPLALVTRESEKPTVGMTTRRRLQVELDDAPQFAGEKKADDSTIDNDTMSQATSQFYETTSLASEVSDTASLSSDRFSFMSATVQSSRGSRSTGLRPVARKAFVDPETLRRLKTRAEESNASKSLTSPSTPSTASQRSSPGAPVDVDDISVVSDDASQITSASAYFDAASQFSGGDASDAGGGSLRSGYSRASAASGYSRFSVVSAPAFVRSEVGKVKDKHGNVTSTRKVFVDSATLKKLQRRSRPKPTSSSSVSSYRKKPFISPSMLEELTEGGSIASIREQGRFEPVYEEPPDDNWRDEIKVFAPSAKKKAHGSQSDGRRSRKRDGDRPASSGASVGGGSVGGTSVGGSSVNRRVSFARDVVFSEDFKADDRFAEGDDDNSNPRADDDGAANHDEQRRPRRRAWYQTREFQAGVGTLVASGASIGTLIASKLMKGR